MNLYIIAGEASGDARGAELMQSLARWANARGEDLTFHGAGGPEMKKLVPTLEDWSGEAVVGLWDVLKKYPYFHAKFQAMLAEIEEVKPDAVILIDYPGFNLRIAKALKKRNPLQSIIYYISPQVWAWNRERIPQMAQSLDLMLCIFPFEKVLYEDSGLRTVFVGHPLVDTLAPLKEEPGVERVENLVGLFPGSRLKEITYNLPIMLAAVRELRQFRPRIRVQIAAATEALATVIHELSDGNQVEILVGGAYEIMRKASVGIVASGTATLEAACFEMPFVIVYRVAGVTWEIGKRLVKVPHLGMPNVLAGREIVREFLQHEALPEQVAGEVIRLLTNEQKRETLIHDLQGVIAMLGGGGASERAAAAIIEELDELRELGRIHATPIAY